MQIQLTESKATELQGNKYLHQDGKLCAVVVHCCWKRASNSNGCDLDIKGGKLEVCCQETECPWHVAKQQQSFNYLIKVWRPVILHPS